MPDRKSVDTLATTLMVLLTATWGLQQVSLKLAAADMAPVLQIALRSGVAALIIGGLVLKNRELGSLAPVWKSGLLAGLFFSLEFVLVGEGLKHTSASHMSIYLYTAPIFTALGLHLKVPEERMNSIQWGGILLAFIGVVLAFVGRTSAPAGDSAWIGDLMGIGAGMALASTNLTIRLTRLSSAPATVTLLYQLLMACAVLGFAALITRQTSFTITPVLIGSLAFQAIIVSTISFLVWFTLFRRYQVQRLTVLTFLTPVFGAWFGVTLLNDNLDLGFILGSLLVLGGIFVVSNPAKFQWPFKARPSAS
jgi:drug/metabolite transporter (DMT)-like permease